MILAGPQLFQPCFTGVIPVRRAVMGVLGCETVWFTAAGATAACVGAGKDVAVISIVGGTVDVAAGAGEEVMTAVTKDCSTGVEVAATPAAGDITVAVTGALRSKFEWRRSSVVTPLSTASGVGNELLIGGRGGANIAINGR